MNAAQFAAALDHDRHAGEDADLAAVRITYVDGYRRLTGLAPVDTGGHRAGVAPFSGAGGGSTFIRESTGIYPHPGDGLARTVAAGFQYGDRIGYKDLARTRTGFQYGIMIQPPSKRPLFGFAPGSRPAASPKAPEGDYAVVYEQLETELPRNREIAWRRAWGAAR